MATAKAELMPPVKPTIKLTVELTHEEARGLKELIGTTSTLKGHWVIAIYSALNELVGK